MNRLFPILAILTLLLGSCASEPQPVENGGASYVVTTYHQDGSVRASYSARSITERGFPPTVTFRDSRNRTITIKGSYLVQEVR